MGKRSVQTEFTFRTWGGKRKGAGRLPSGKRAGVPHLAREILTGRDPIHVTMRVAADVWNLRSRRCATVLESALEASAIRNGMRITHYSIQGNHLHLLVEAANHGALSRGMKGLQVRMARGLNRLIGRKGRVFVDRYHAHVLHTPTEARNAVRYVLGNTRVHASRRGAPIPAEEDPFACGPPLEWAANRSTVLGSIDSGHAARSSRTSRPRQLTLFPEGPTAPPETWLLRKAIESRNP